MARTPNEFLDDLRQFDQLRHLVYNRFGGLLKIDVHRTDCPDHAAPLPHYYLELEVEDAQLDELLAALEASLEDMVDRNLSSYSETE